MEKGTFGDQKKYKSLKFICNRLDSLPKNKKSIVSKMINNLNDMCIGTKTIDNEKLFNFVKKCLKVEFESKIDNFKEFDEDGLLSSHLKNFIHAKINPLKYEKIKRKS